MRNPRSSSSNEIPRRANMRANMHSYYGQPDNMPPQNGQGYSSPPIPPNARPTLYVDGLPSDMTRRELAHIFRSFRGYIGSRIIKLIPHLNRDVVIVQGIVKFRSAADAALAMHVKQGYKLDQGDPDSPHLRLGFVYPYAVHQISLVVEDRLNPGHTQSFELQLD